MYILHKSFESLGSLDWEVKEAISDINLIHRVINQSLVTDNFSSTDHLAQREDTNNLHRIRGVLLDVSKGSTLDFGESISIKWRILDIRHCGLKQALNLRRSRRGHTLFDVDLLSQLSNNLSPIY